MLCYELLWVNPAFLLMFLVIYKLILFVFIKYIGFFLYFPEDSISIIDFHGCYFVPLHNIAGNEKGEMGKLAGTANHILLLSNNVCLLKLFKNCQTKHRNQDTSCSSL